MKDSMQREWVRIPIKDVSSHAFIAWQCGSDEGMTLNRLAETCGCASHEQEGFGCHHPANIEYQCLANSCPLASVSYPEGASEEECDRINQGYGDEIQMQLDESTSNNFGEGGNVKSFWMRERRNADETVLDALEVMRLQAQEQLVKDLSQKLERMTPDDVQALANKLGAHDTLKLASNLLNVFVSEETSAVLQTRLHNERTRLARMAYSKDALHT